MAVADIAGRLVGVIKTGLERYADFGYTQSANRIDQSETENLAASIGEKAINKIGLDEDEIKEIDPVCLEGYRFENAYQKYGDDKLWRSSKYEVTWIFASDKQLYVYSYQFNLDEDGKRERTEEYFWKDITNFSTITETREVGVDWDSKKGEYTSRKNIDTQDFAIVVPGDKYICAARQDESVETAIRAMKAKLREKKNA